MWVNIAWVNFIDISILWNRRCCVQCLSIIFQASLVVCYLLFSRLVWLLPFSYCQQYFTRNEWTLLVFAKAASRVCSTSHNQIASLEQQLNTLMHGTCVVWNKVVNGSGLCNASYFLIRLAHCNQFLSQQNTQSFNYLSYSVPYKILTVLLVTACLCKTSITNLKCSSNCISIMQDCNLNIRFGWFDYSQFHWIAELWSKWYLYSWLLTSAMNKCNCT